jgi:cytoskeletal protein CcmA (bactofilin family)
VGAQETPAPTGGGRSVVGPGTLIRGTLRGEGPVVIQGAVEGRIDLRGGLTVTATGRVDAEVEARTVLLAGEARGTLRASERVEVASTAIFEGELATPALDVRPGSVVRGRTRVSEPGIEAPPEPSH